MKLKAFVKDKETKKCSFIETEIYSTKSEFIFHLRACGYSVDPNKVKTAEVFDWIMDHTDCEKAVWKYVNKIPDSKESASDMIWKGIEKTEERHKQNFEKKFGYRI